MLKLHDILSLEDYIKRFKGTGIRDCAVINRYLFYFVTFQDWDEETPRPFSEELETRLTSLDLQSDKRWLTTYSKGYSGLMCSGPQEPDTNCIAIDGMGQVLADAIAGPVFENDVPGGLGNGPLRADVRRIKSLSGRLYGCGGQRSVFYRLGPNQWKEVGQLPPSKKENIGFEDVDLFTESDIYAAGAKGDVWHFDGQTWRRIAFPSDMSLESICCGGDGYVYIGAQSGTVFRGRGDDWTMIQRGDLTLPFRDMVWFQDRVYATNDYGLWEIQDGQVRPSDAPIEITNCAGNLSVADGVMLMAGAYGAALHDGTSWSRLFSLIELEREALANDRASKLT